MFKKVITNAVMTLSQCAHSQNSSLSEVEQLHLSDLDEFLSHFFAQVRKQDGSLFSRNGILSTHYGLRTHFNKTRGCDIINDSLFHLSNDMLKHETSTRNH